MNGSVNRSRRRFLEAIAAASAGLLTACGREEDLQVEDTRPSRRGGESRSLLILGGTGFVGPPIVRRALERGYDVTLFNRGRTNANLFPDLELLVGDRDGDLDSILDAIRGGRGWDAALDLSGYVARHVADSARLLARAVDQYVFVSSVAVYSSFAEPNDEDSPVIGARGGDYGSEKAQAERELLAAIPDRVSILRPTYIAGPGDNTDRFTYWPVRVARGGEMLVPGPPDRPIQFIDVRDVAAFTIACIEERTFGTFNTAIPARSYAMADLIDDSLAASGSGSTPVWVSPEFVRSHSIDSDNRLPIWESPLGDRRAFPLISAERAASAGLRTRAPLDTVRDTLDWWSSLGANRRSVMRAGLSPAMESELLAEWRRQ